MDNQAPKKEHMIKSGIEEAMISLSGSIRIKRH
jgi:hypothetical protein